MILYSPRPIEFTPDELEEMAAYSGAEIDMGGDRDRLVLPDGRRYYSRRAAAS